MPLISSEDQGAKFSTSGIAELTQKNVELIARMEKASNASRTRGECVADQFAAVVGSWPFIIVQTILLTIWVVLNVIAWSRHWDPYPFILLNLALSFQAAYASPIIMMSQNRQGRLAERRNELDLQINLLAEQETTQILRLLQRLCKHTGVPMTEEADVDALSNPTEPGQLAEQIQNSAKAK